MRRGVKLPRWTPARPGRAEQVPEWGPNNELHAFVSCGVGFDLGHEQISPAHLGDSLYYMRRLLGLSSLHSLLEKCLAFGCPMHG